MRWERGAQILHRFLMHGEAVDVRPVTVVADDEDALVLWLAHGTPTRVAQLPGGIDLRSVTKRQMFGQRWQSGPRDWVNNVLMTLPADAPHAIWSFFAPDGTFTNWYANLQSPGERWSGGVDIVDHQLDLVVSPGHDVDWKDADELEAALEAGWYTADDSVRIYAEAHRLAELAADGKPPFDDPWQGHRPDPLWPTPTLPAHWAAPGQSETGFRD
jgi:hypothetical protein